LLWASVKANVLAKQKCSSIIQNMITRKYFDLLKERLGKYPAVALVGPRQAGKTTIAKSLGGRYFDLEQETDRVNLDLQWDRGVADNKLIILDEAQEWPDVFKRVRGAIDHDRKRHGRFLLLGSVSPALMKHVSESLAGRMTLLELTPFLWPELSKENKSHLWLYGGYPDGGILHRASYPQWQHDYMELLAGRDLPNWGLPAKPRLTRRLFKMLAAVNGQMFNASQIGKSLDLSYKTVSSYLDYLEGAFLIRRLPSYHVNLKKRLVKNSKIYWRDSGLLHTLNNIATQEILLNQPWVGASWEGFVVEQVISSLKLNNKACEAYFFRTSDGYELDLVLDFGFELWAVEIKLTSSPTISDIERLNKAADMIGAKKRILISRTSRNVDDGNRFSCNLDWFLEHFCR